MYHRIAKCQYLAKYRWGGSCTDRHLGKSVGDNIIELHGLFFLKIPLIVLLYDGCQKSSWTPFLQLN